MLEQRICTTCLVLSNRILYTYEELFVLLVVPWRKNIVKIICKQQDLSRGLSAVSHAVSSRSTLPILSNILLATDQGRLKLAATNLEIGINCWVDAQIQEEGTTTVPAKLLADFVSSLPQAPVDMSVAEDKNILNIESSGSIA